MSQPSQKIAIVTGANRGIGRAIAEGLAARGCLVYVGVRETGKAADVVQSITDAGHRAEELVIDVGCESSVKGAHAAFTAQHSQLHVLINNAGIFVEDRDDPLLEVPPETFLEEFDINVMGAHRVTSAFHPELSATTDARVINMSSSTGQLSTMNEPFGPGYSVSKTALNALTRQQAAGFSPDDISVNCMSPGWVRTDMGGEGADRSTEEGADTAIWLALDCESGVSGKFFRSREEIPW